MSALTKIFVVLLVVLSLMLSAGLIVFVNRQENYKQTAKDAMTQAADAKKQLSLRNAEIAQLAAAKSELGANLTTQINALNTQIASLNQTITQKDGQINELNQNLTQANAANVSISEGLKTAQAQIKALGEQIASLATERDRLAKLNSEDSNRITDLTYQIETVTKHDRFATEQVNDRDTQIAQLREILHKYNISPSGTTNPPGGAINSTPSVNINGIVRSYKQVDGVPFATISLGSADAVTRGMKFSVIDPTHNRFLGYLVVDQVNSHDATGRLEGPAINEIRANVSEVRTQL